MSDPVQSFVEAAIDMRNACTAAMNVVAIYDTDHGTDLTALLVEALTEAKVRDGFGVRFHAALIRLDHARHGAAAIPTEPGRPEETT